MKSTSSNQLASSNANSNGNNRPNSLIFEVHDNFAFEEINDHHNQTADSIHQALPSSINADLMNGRLSLEKHLANISGSPTRHGIPSYFNSNFDENGYVFDGVKIDIEDIDNTSVSNITTQSLKRCKSQVLKHYYNLLCFIGWRPFYKEYYYRTPWYVKVINFLYPIIIVSLLVYSYAYDLITCQGRLNVAYDTQFIAPATLAPALTRPHNSTSTSTPKTHYSETLMDSLYNTSSGQASIFNSIYGKTSKKPVDHIDPELKREDQCGHIVTTYILPSFMHFVAYLLGFFYFRINENEQLYALMEKVFLAVNQTLKVVSQDRVIRRLKIFIVFGVFWVLLAMSLHILSRAAFGFDKVIFNPQWASITLEAISLIIANSVYLAVVINHTTQCEMIIFYVNEIKTRLEEKSITLKEAVQQILDIRIAIGNLNSTVSKMTTLVALIFIEKFIIGLIILILNRVYEPLAWIYRGAFVISWFMILAFTLIQVARLNSHCSKFKQIALSARVYGYHASSRDELDSFLLFVSNAKLRAKLFGISLQPSVILGTAIVITFTLIILFQTSVISTPDSII